MAEKKQEKAFLAFEGKIIPIKKEIIRIGRHQDNDFIITDPTVSRFHAEIHFEAGEYVLYDMDSTSGVFVNRKKVERSVIHSGDIITLSTFPMMFVMDLTEVKGLTHAETGELEDDDESDNAETRRQYIG